MSVEELKQKIHAAVENTNDENQLIRILEVIEGDDADIPEWHKQILEERLEEYRKNPNAAISLEQWNEEVKKKYGV